MTQFTSSPFCKISGIILLAVLFLFCGAAHAGSIFIDTTGVSGTVGETVQVPVKVTDAKSLYTLELKCGTGTTDVAVVSFNETSMQEHGLIYSQETGKVAQINLGITGEDVLFYLDVTPKKASDVDLTLSLLVTREGTIETVAPTIYTSSGATLSVSGSSTSGTPPVTPDTPPQTPTTPPVTPDIPQDAPDTPPQNPENPPVTLDTPQETPEIPDEILPSVPEMPQTPVNPPTSPLPFTGIIGGLATALCLVRKHH